MNEIQIVDEIQVSEAFKAEEYDFNPLDILLEAPTGYRYGWCRYKLPDAPTKDYNNLNQAVDRGWYPVRDLVHPLLKPNQCGYFVYKDLVLCVKENDTFSHKVEQEMRSSLVGIQLKLRDEITKILGFPDGSEMVKTFIKERDEDGKSN